MDGEGGKPLHTSPHPALSAAHLDDRLPTPLYHQVYLVLREQILAGALTADTVVPGEQELARRFGVSRITVKRALNELSADGLVTRHRGRGTIVARGRKSPVVKGSFDTLIESLRIMGLETEVELLEVRAVAADADMAELLALPKGAPLQRAVRRRKIEGEPFSHLVTYVPAEIAERYAVEDLASTPLLSLLEQAGAAALDAEQWITAVAADPVIAQALEVSIGAPLLKIERVMRGSKGTPVQLIHAHYRPDRFQYHVRAHRRRGGGWRETG